MKKKHIIQYLNYILNNLNKKKVIYANLAYSDILIQYKFNIVKILEKILTILIKIFAENDYVINFIDLYEDSYKLYMFLKILEIKIILKEIFSYNYHSSYLVFRSIDKPSRHKILKRLYNISPD